MGDIDMDTIRAFIALGIDDLTKDIIYDFIEKIKKKRAFEDIRRDKRQNLHLTLAFLGEIPVDSIPAIDCLIKEVASNNCKFKIRFTGIGFFPNLRSPRVCWIGVEEQLFLEKLKKDIDNGLERIGLRYDKKPFSPHLTIGRIKANKNKISIEHIRGLNIDVSYTASNIWLMKSQLFREGPLYTYVTGSLLKKRK